MSSLAADAARPDMLATLADEVTDVQAAVRGLAERQARLEGEREQDSARRCGGSP